MDWKTFLANLVDSLTSLAWPAAAVWVAFIFREQIENLVQRLRKATFRGSSLDFDADLASAEEVLSSLPPPETEVKVPAEIADRLQGAKLIAEKAPTQAIVYAWHSIDLVAIAALATAGASGPTAVGRRRALKAMGILSQESIQLYEHLRHLRNQSLHDESFEPSTRQALEFIDLAEELIARIKAGEDRLEQRRSRERAD